VDGFTAVLCKYQRINAFATKSTSPCTSTSLWNSETEENSWEGFNPFEKKKTATTLNPLITSNNQISLRQLRMKELMNTLLQKVSLDEIESNGDGENKNDAALYDILDQNSELLLEPLNDADAVMDRESIYDPGMSRDERFDRYDQVMEERIEKASNKSVRRILSTMKDYVSSKR